MNKRGQFFILAAVIISVLIFGISMTVNSVDTYEDFTNLDKYSEMIDKEMALVQNYEIYTGVDDDNLENFVNVLSATLKDQDPSMNFAIFYGDKNSISVKNYGENGVRVNGHSIVGTSGNEGTIMLETGPLTTSTNIGGELVLLNPDEETVINFDDKTYYFTIPNYNVIVFILEKEDGDEKYITIK